jgi:DNA-directed RNA polymerase specialized sigma24 family protein
MPDISHISLFQSEIVLTAIREGNGQAVMKSVYQYMMPNFVKWAARRYQAETAAFPDVFQDMLLEFYLKALNQPGFSIQHESVVPYFWGIWKNKLASLYKKRKWYVLTDFSSFKHSPVEAPKFPVSNIAYETILQKALQNLTPICRQILTITLIDQKNTRQAAEIMHYSDIATASVVRSRCFTTLKTDLRNMLTPDQLEDIIQNI